MDISLNLGRPSGIPTKRPLLQYPPDGGSATSRDFQDFLNIYSRRPIADPRDSEFPPIAPSKWRYRWVAVGRVGIPHGLRTFTAEPAGRRMQDLLKNLRYRPEIHEVRNSAHAPQLRGAFAEFREIGWEFPWVAPHSPHNRPGGGSVSRRDFSRFSEDSTQSPIDPRSTEFRHISRSKWRFSEFRPIG